MLRAPHFLQSKLLQSKLFWVGVLYFAEGFPFGVFNDVLPVYFRRLGVDLREIGFLSLLGLAWTIKFLWAPAVDYYRQHRRWMAVVDFGMSALLLVVAVYNDFSIPVQIAIALFAVLSATNDVAIDGYTVELLDKNELGRANGVRFALYRVGLAAAYGILIISPHITWLGAYSLCAALLVLCGMACLFAPHEPARMVVKQRFFLGRLLLVAAALVAIGWSVDIGMVAVLKRLLPQYEAPIKGLAIVGTVLAIAAVAMIWLRREAAVKTHAAGAAAAPLFAALAEMLQRPRIVPVILFVLSYKLGDVALGPMVKPFWVDAGFLDAEIGWVSGIGGIGLGVAGGVVGGWVIDRIGIFRALWILGLLQALANLGYVWAAYVIPLPTAGHEVALAHRAIVYFASINESFCLGLGGVALFSFLMAIVNKKYSAAEYAILSSLFALTRHLTGFASGYGAHYMGYAPYFVLTFFLHFPAFLLLPWVRKMLIQTGVTK